MLYTEFGHTTIVSSLDSLTKDTYTDQLVNTFILDSWFLKRHKSIKFAHSQI